MPSREGRRRAASRPVDGPAEGVVEPNGAEAPDGPEDEAAAEAAASALARARRAAADRGLRPGVRPLRRRHGRDGSAGTSTASGSGPDARDPVLVGEQLDRMVADRGWEVDLAVGSVLGRWPQIVGPGVAEHVTPVSFDRGVLTLRADSTAWATQMRLLSSVLLGRLEQEVGAGTVAEVKVTGPSAPSWVKGRRRAQGRGPRDTYG